MRRLQWKLRRLHDATRGLERVWNEKNFQAEYEQIIAEKNKNLGVVE